MTLEEAIEHCREKSCNNSECAAEHKQLAEWLTELKALKDGVASKDIEQEKTRLFPNSKALRGAFELGVLWHMQQTYKVMSDRERLLHYLLMARNAALQLGCRMQNNTVVYNLGKLLDKKHDSIEKHFERLDKKV